MHSIAVIGAHADVGVMSGEVRRKSMHPGETPSARGSSTKWGEAVYFPSPPLRYIQEHSKGAAVQFDAGTEPPQRRRLRSPRTLPLYSRIST